MGHRITHLGLCVTDLERSVSFYRDAIGMVEDGRLTTSDPETAVLLGLDEVELEIAYLVRDGLRLELLHYVRPDTIPADGARPMNLVGFTHLSIRVAALAPVAERIVACGGRVLSETQVTFFGQTPAVMALDPDGVRLELLEGYST